MLRCLFIKGITVLLACLLCFSAAYACPTGYSRSDIGICWPNLGPGPGPLPTAPPIGGAVGEIGEAIKGGINRNKEAIAAVVVVALIIYGVCIGGCDWVAEIKLKDLGDVSIKVATGTIGVDAVTSSPQATAHEQLPQSSPNPSESDSPSLPEGSGIPPVHVEVFPKDFIKMDFPEGVPPVVKYKPLGDDLHIIFNEFSFPNYTAYIRYPSVSDPSGGVLESPRNDVSESLYATYGAEARRVHGGIDFLVAPHTPVVATMSGVIGPIYSMKDRDLNPTSLKMILIRAKDGTVSRVLYVEPNEGISEGMEVKAGETVIGKAQDLSVKYPSTVPNHIHVDFTAPNGNRFDPWTNKEVSTNPMANSVLVPASP